MEQNHPNTPSPVQLYLPVASQDNVQSRYSTGDKNTGSCTTLSPFQALERFTSVQKNLPVPLSVVLSGPGDVLAAFSDTRETLRLIRQTSSAAILEIETNGLLLPVYATHLISLGVTRVTVFLNSVYPETGAKLIDSVLYMGNRYTGVEGANILLQNQIDGINYLTSRGIEVTLTLMTAENINGHELESIFELAAELGCQIGKILPLNLDTEKKKLHPDKTSVQYRFAVCTSDGRLIDQHFGQATAFHIYDCGEGGAEFVETRPIEDCGHEFYSEMDADRIYSLIKTIEDCQCVLCTRIGYCPSQTLSEKKIDAFVTYNLIEDGLAEAYFRQRNKSPFPQSN